MGCFIVNIIMSGRAHLLLMETKKEITPINRHCVIKDLSHCLTDFFVTNQRNFDLETKIFFRNSRCVCLPGFNERCICFTVGLS